MLAGSGIFAYLCSVQTSTGLKMSPHKAAIFMPPLKSKCYCSTAWGMG